MSDVEDSDEGMLGRGGEGGVVGVRGDWGRGTTAGIGGRKWDEMKVEISEKYDGWRQVSS